MNERKEQLDGLHSVYVWLFRNFQWLSKWRLNLYSIHYTALGANDFPVFQCEFFNDYQGATERCQCRLWSVEVVFRYEQSDGFWVSRSFLQRGISSTELRSSIRNDFSLICVRISYVCSRRVVWRLSNLQIYCDILSDNLSKSPRSFHN